MNNSSRFRISLHVTHPEISADQICSNILLPVRYKRSFGEKKRTRSGRELGGEYLKTDVSFDISGGVLYSDKVNISDCVKNAASKLPKHFLNDISKTEGEAFFLFGIYSEDNMLACFSSDLLLFLGTMSLGLKFDFYGGPEDGGPAT